MFEPSESDKILVDGIMRGIDSAVLEMQRALLMWIAAPMFFFMYAANFFSTAEIPWWIALVGVASWMFGWLLRPKGRKL